MRLVALGYLAIAGSIALSTLNYNKIEQQIVMNRNAQTVYQAQARDFSVKFDEAEKSIDEILTAVGVDSSTVKRKIENLHKQVGDLSSQIKDSELSYDDLRQRLRNANVSIEQSRSINDESKSLIRLVETRDDDFKRMVQDLYDKTSYQDIESARKAVFKALEEKDARTLNMLFTFNPAEINKPKHDKMEGYLKKACDFGNVFDCANSLSIFREGFITVDKYNDPQYQREGFEYGSSSGSGYHMSRGGQLDSRVTQIYRVYRAVKSRSDKNKIISIDLWLINNSWRIGTMSILNPE